MLLKLYINIFTFWAVFFLLNCHILDVQLEKRSYKAEKNQNYSDRYASYGWGVFHSSSPKMIQCKEGLETVRIRRDAVDAVIHYFLGGIISTRKIESRCPGDMENIAETLRKDKKISLNTIQFDPDSSRILDESHPIADELAKFLKEKKKVRIKITGHAAVTGQLEKSRKLSKARAESVKAYLVSAGVTEDRIETEGQGESHPLLNARDEHANTLNRRVEFETYE